MIGIRSSIAALALAFGVVFPAATVASPPAIRIDAPTVEATDSSGADASYHVKSYDPDSGDPRDATCDIPGGTAGSGDFDSPVFHFPLGPTTVTCTSSSGSGSAQVVVQDTTPPTLTLPSNVTVDATGPTVVNYTEATANDAVSGPITPTCSKHSGDTFPLGTTTVSCTAKDSSGNTASGSFTVTVHLIDNEAPTLTVPNPGPTAEATSASGAAVSYTVTATDNADPSPSINCDHPSGSTFPLGPTVVHCTATDDSGNSAQASFTVAVQDMTPPTLSLPADMTVSVGSTVTYSATASDLVDGAVPVSCSPSSGSSFPFGTTTVSCSAADSHGNKATGTFHVTVADITPPVLSNVPGPIKVEANSHAGSVVNFTTPTATDDVDGPIANVVCAPASGSTFSLGSTTVTCSATDSSGNTGSASFTVSVVDTTPPHLIPPGDRSVYATTPSGLYPADEAANAFLHGYTVSDVADAHPVVTTNAPPFFFLGVTVVTFTARDASGNTAKADARLDVLPMPEAGTTPAPLPPPTDRTPPDDVTDLVVTSGDGVVTLKWTNPKATDFDHAQISRSTTEAGSEPQVVYQGSATTFRDRGLQNGVEYRYIVKAVDKAGNGSAGVVAVAFPKASGLLAPKAGARVKGVVKFKWKKVKGAKYYNLQAFYGGTRIFAATADAKVLSAWPTKPSFVLKKTWRYAGRKRTLKLGVYTWYVWPGFGPRSAAEYGELIGSRSFTVVR
jgi:hypothetical protein